MDPASVTITAEPLNVERCKFVVGVPVYTGGLRRFTAPHEATGSPLAEALFAIPDAEIQEVIVSGNLVTVVKASTLPWQVLGKQIGAAIRQALAGPRPAIAPKEEVAAGPVDDDTLYERVSRLFDEEVNPMVARHGGRVELVDGQGALGMVRLAGGGPGGGVGDEALGQGVVGGPG